MRTERRPSDAPPLRAIPRLTVYPRACPRCTFGRVFVGKQWGMLYSASCMACGHEFDFHLAAGRR